MSTITTIAGRAYAITPTTNCTVSTPDGVIICRINANCQAVIIAPCDNIIVSDNRAYVTQTFKGAASAALGGGANDLPIGTILPSACAAMNGYLLCNGAAVSRIEYEGLFQAIGTNYGKGDGQQTFNLPDMQCRTVWGADNSSPAGTKLVPGLPNIAGQLSVFTYADGNPAGAFGATIVTQNVLGGGAGVNYNHVWSQFSAARSNSIYGASTTVQPPALCLNFFIKY